ncbi:MAG: restriction endonuclease subunit S, partial [Paramuribaculum sp.]|nr:restriction endonuclease subunit S [Paramuribaculum sp.]
MEIDKSTWNYIEFDKIGNFFSGYTPKSNEISENDSVPYFKVAEMNIPGNERWLHCTSLFVDDSHKVFPPNSIVFPKNGAAVSTNKKRILSVYSVVDLNTAGVTLHERCLPLYAYYWILTKDFNEFIRRGAVPTLNLKALKKEIFPLPSLEIQKNIVSELDMLQEVIDGYKAQIFDLDALAQSIFLDTFGDPISNPKGWELNPISSYIKKTRNIAWSNNSQTYKYIDLTSVGRTTGIIRDTILVNSSTAPSRA